MQNYYQFIISRLNGSEIRKKFAFYRALARKGVAGFIVFGGELRTLRKYLTALQEEAELPLIISSDLERGLGQQVKGGTLFPPAMALASAVRSSRQSAISSKDLRLLRDSFRAVAVEAAYAGINTIFAPVLDINTNPLNPIISVRAFGEDPETVSFFGCEMIRQVQDSGIIACGKHFPGHGDTSVDSHLRLPVVDKSLARLKRNELIPFQRAIAAGVKMIMLGHLNIPALDRSGTPVSLSEKAVGYLRNTLQFKGIVITDAMNMGGIGAFSEEEAALKALEAGVDILLHPTDAEKIVAYLEGKNMVFHAGRLKQFRSGLRRKPSETLPQVDLHNDLAHRMTAKAIRPSADFRVRGESFLIILNDDEQRKGDILSSTLKKHLPSLITRVLRKGAPVREMKFTESAFVIIAVFSETKAWKDGASSWLTRQIASIEERADLFISFGSPYLFPQGKKQAKAAEIFAYWDAEPAQRAVAELIAGKTA